MVIIDSPAHIYYAPKIENSVRVQDGTNYDMSRGGVSTPVVRLPDPVPVMPVAVIEYTPPADLERTPYEGKHRIPGTDPVAVINFARNGSVLSVTQIRELKALKKGQSYIVVGHADNGETDTTAVAKARAKAVAARISGSKVLRAVSFADTLPLSANPFNAEKNRRVEVFIH